jgi:hypothetical protein
MHAHTESEQSESKCESEAHVNLFPTPPQFQVVARDDKALLSHPPSGFSVFSEFNVENADLFLSQAVALAPPLVQNVATHILVPIKQFRGPPRARFKPVAMGRWACYKTGHRT